MAKKTEASQLPTMKKATPKAPSPTADSVVAEPPSASTSGVKGTLISSAPKTTHRPSHHGERWAKAIRRDFNSTCQTLSVRGGTPRMRILLHRRTIAECRDAARDDQGELAKNSGRFVRRVPADNRPVM